MVITPTLIICVKRRDGFPKANPFPKTIFENVAYGLRGTVSLIK
jgi:ABC-type phosphate transport system ATPase subunit